MKTVVVNLRLRQQRALYVVLPPLLLTVLVTVIAVPLRTDGPPLSDGIGNVAAATNLARQGVFSVDQRDKPDLQPDGLREPLYPAILAAVLTLMSHDDVATSCMVEGAPACSETLRALRFVNVALLVGLSLSTFALARTAGLGRGAALAAAASVGLCTTFTSDVDQFFSTLLSTTLLTLAAIPLVKIARGQTSWKVVLAGGVLLGLLMQTRASFVYSAVVCIPLAVLVSRSLARNVTRQVAIMVMVAWTLTVPWSLRNAEQFGTFSVTTGGGPVLAVRAEASTFRWEEYPWAFAAYTPELGPAALEQFASDAPWRRWDRRFDNSFYRLATGHEPGGVVQSRLGVVGGENLQDAALSVAMDHPIKFAALTLPYAWRGAFIEAGRAPLASQNTPVGNGLRTVIGPPTMLCALALFPLAALGMVRAVRARDAEIIMMVSLVLGSWLFHVLATHYIRRYSHPMVPTLAVLVLCSLRRPRVAEDRPGATNGSLEVGQGA